MVNKGAILKILLSLTRGGGRRGGGVGGGGGGAVTTAGLHLAWNWGTSLYVAIFGLHNKQQYWSACECVCSVRKGGGGGEREERRARSEKGWREMRGVGVGGRDRELKNQAN